MSFAFVAVGFVFTVVMLTPFWLAFMAGIPISHEWWDWLWGLGEQQQGEDEEQEYG